MANPHGSFVKKDTSSGLWFDVGNFAAREKISRMFRELLPEKYKSSAANRKTKPIHRREGKIDIYKPRPVYDEETIRLLAEQWKARKRVSLVKAEIAQEQRVAKVRHETSDRIAHFDAEIQLVEDKAEKARQQRELEHARSIETMQEEQQQRELEYTRSIEKMQEEQEQRELEYAQSVETMREESTRALAEKDQEIQRVKDQAREERQRREEEYTQSVETMRTESAKALSKKDKEINSLNNEIRSLLEQLQEKRLELKEKTTNIDSLETQLRVKESTLETLQQERASLRKLAQQSGRVLMTRFQRRVLRQDDDVVADGAENEEDDNEDDGKGTTTNDEARKRGEEKVSVPSRKSKEWWK